MQDGQGVEWHHHGLVADLSEKPIKWRKLPKTNWKVRANSAAVVGNSLFVIGGLDDNGTSNAVRRLDLDTNKWSDEAPFPGVNRLKAFGSAACNLNGRLLACGFSYQPRVFNDSNSSWSDSTAKVVGKRFFHRMVPIGKGQVVFIGGADFEGHLDSFEVLDFRKDLSSKSSSNEKSESPQPDSKGAQWGGFRGNGNSRSLATTSPIKWSDESNVRWRSTLSGFGQSTPVVWRRRVFTTTTEGNFSENLLVHCHELSTGKLLWKKK